MRRMMIGVMGENYAYGKGKEVHYYTLKCVPSVGRRAFEK
jgi:hypothetical protein